VERVCQVRRDTASATFGTIITRGREDDVRTMLALRWCCAGILIVPLHKQSVQSAGDGATHDDPVHLSRLSGSAAVGFASHFMGLDRIGRRWRSRKAWRS
jgi:hypothetical protein